MKRATNGEATAPAEGGNAKNENNDGNNLRKYLVLLVDEGADGDDVIGDRKLIWKFMTSANVLAKDEVEAMFLACDHLADKNFVPGAVWTIEKLEERLEALRAAALSDTTRVKFNSGCHNEEDELVAA